MNEIENECKECSGYCPFIAAINQILSTYKALVNDPLVKIESYAEDLSKLTNLKNGTQNQLVEAFKLKGLINDQQPIVAVAYNVMLNQLRPFVIEGCKRASTPPNYPL